MKFIVAFALAAVATSAAAQTAPNPFERAGAGVRGGVQQIMGQAFDKVDANRDGYATREEVARFAQSRGISNARMDGTAWGRADQNRDGVVSRAEFMAVIMYEFDTPARIGGQR
jgi:hypothetical protein